MRDERLERLAESLFGHSLQLQAGDIVQIRASVEAKPLVMALYRRAAEIGLYLLIQWQDEEITRLNYDLLAPEKPGTEEFLKLTGSWEYERCQNITAYLTIRAQSNDRELSGIEPLRLEMVAKASEKASDCIINQRQ